MTELLELFEANAQAAGFQIHHDSIPELQEAGVSKAAYGLADTGSVVLVASPDEPRARSLLPPVHVSVLTRDRVLPGLEALFAEVGDALPSALAIVTGPSCSADVEFVLAPGVHGPAEVHIVLVDPDRPDHEFRR